MKHVRRIFIGFGLLCVGVAIAAVLYSAYRGIHNFIKNYSSPEPILIAVGIFILAYLVGWAITKYGDYG